MIQITEPHHRTAVASVRTQFRADVLDGLDRFPKQLPPKYFYDRRGSALFDAICDLQEYYVTRTELAIMQANAADIAAELPTHGALIELGSGSSVKTRLLLDQLPELRTYVPVDISGEHLLATAEHLRELYSQLEVAPVAADFSQPFAWPASCQNLPRTIYFPGSTIGNFEPSQAKTLLRRIAQLAGSAGGLLVGIDLQKDPDVIEAAYNDSLGVTAAFNQNLLHRINRELGGDFHVPHFVHEAQYDVTAGRIEMRLRCSAAQHVRIAGRSFRIEQGEAIRTEYSHKYTIDGFAEMASGAGLHLRRQWTDQRRYCAVLLLECER